MPDFILSLFFKIMNNVKEVSHAMFLFIFVEECVCCLSYSVVKEAIRNIEPLFNSENNLEGYLKFYSLKI